MKKRSQRVCMPACRLIWNRRGLNCGRDGVAPVELEVIYRRKRKWVSCGVKVSASEWDEKRMRVKGRMDMLEVNEKLAMMVERCEAVMAECLRSGVEFSLEMVGDAIRGRKAEEIVKEKPVDKWKECNFVDWVEDRVNERNDLSVGTLKTHRTLVEKLREFNAGGGRLETFADISKVNIIAFDDWLKRRNYKQTSVYGYHKRLKRYVNEAVRREMLEVNPYSLLKIERGRSDGVKYIEKEMVWKLRDMELDVERLRKVRDLYVFQCYTGLAYADLAKFDFGQCVERDGRWWLRDRRVKSDEEYWVLLLPAAMEILRRWEMRLPVMSNQKYNDWLKILAEKAGIGINLTTHTARHTFGVMMVNEGVEIETLAKMMGHTQIQTTQIYAKVLGKSVEKAFLKVEGKV